MYSAHTYFLGIWYECFVIVADGRQAIASH